VLIHPEAAEVIRAVHELRAGHHDRGIHNKDLGKTVD
jgi:hypothetical protein